MQTPLIRRLTTRLRALGFVRERSQGGSVYYRYSGQGWDLLDRPWALRLSDHDVPWNHSRECARDNGGHTWADSDWNLIGEEPADVWKFLLAVVRQVRSIQRRSARYDAWIRDEREATMLSMLAAGCDPAEVRADIRDWTRAIRQFGF